MPFSNTLNIERIFTTAGVHPYDELTWELRDVSQANWQSGETIFEQAGVEFPDTWSDNASTIVATKYFRGALGSEERESSLKDLVNRVVDTYIKAAKEHGYITEVDQLEIFEHELKWMLVNQMFSFNSPVWFNVGTSSPQQVSACFILSVDDTMDSILNWYREEGMIFKGGSGAGVNLSRIRGSNELLKSSGGSASGPVSFMRGADASAGTIKSGGATRRAAKMVVLDVDHPDIEEFVETKVREEDKIRVLRDAGYDMDLGGKDSSSVQYQNANNSVRVSDKFMQSVEVGGEFDLIGRTNGNVVRTVDARSLFHTIAEAAWACADPGIQYDDTINSWHTAATTGRINGSNPCSEYMSLDNSSCNLASLNLLKFVNDGKFNIAAFTSAVSLVTLAMEISISFADFPTKAIAKTTEQFRQLGIGYANLGALLMSSGIAYNSAEGRGYAGAITSLMSAVAYRTSAQVAGVVGPYAGYKTNKKDHKRVMDKHHFAAENLASTLGNEAGSTFLRDGLVSTNSNHAEIAQAAVGEWSTGLEIGAKSGWRNSQASVLAPTGTIGFMMDCDTTGIEPDFSLIKFKKLVGGGSMQIVNNQVSGALTNLGYSAEVAELIKAYISEHGSVVGCNDILDKHKHVFDCAVGESAITPEGHILMMAAVQPFLSGAISKTVNLPQDATVEDIKRVYTQGWHLGLKAIAVYRDNCKVGQPLSSKAAAESESDTSGASAPAAAIASGPVRERLPRKRRSYTTSFKVGEAEGYITVGEYADGRLGEVFVKMSKQGSTLAGIMDAFSMSTSVALQYGVPLETFVSKLANSRFEPAGMTNDPDIRMAQSVLDYIMRRLALDYLPFDTRSVFGIYSTEERTAALATGVYAPVVEDLLPLSGVGPEPVEEAVVARAHALAGSVTLTVEAPMCTTCGTSSGMTRSGACWACRFCGGSTGCS